MKRIYFIFFTLYSCTIFCQNLLNTSTWEVGNGILPDYKNVGLTQENSRELGVGPYGNNVVLWKGDPSGDSNADGGYESPYVAIDHTKTYRLAVWMKKTNSSNGTTYFGLYSKDNNLQHSTLGLNNSPVGNAYFWYGDLPTLDKWYLLVGYIHQSGYNSTTKIGGIYDGTTGVKVLNVLNDFKFASTAVSLLNRASLFYDPVVADSQYFYAPRIEEVNGSEPTIQQLISTDTSGGGSNTANTSWTNDGNNLYYNGSGNVGIGTINPSSILELKKGSQGLRFLTGENTSGYTLDIGVNDDGVNFSNNSTIRGYNFKNASGTLFKIASNGNVGIGETNPSSKLHVYKGASGGTSHGFSDITVEDSDNGMISILTPSNKYGYYGFADQDDDYVAGMQYEHATNLMRFRVNNHTSDVVINADGNVGIGTATPDSKLAVNGKIHAKEVKVDLVGWPDYVFTEEYNLPTLKEVETHIKEKGHLQNIPSAKEVEENGALLGEMNKKLLEKIEELTLYTIAQDKQLKQQQEINKILEARLNKLEELFNKK
ncbi:tail fiber protein [Aquimarina mytili]|uniref:Peptidase S74 domain-containing protein n=1 Tax=Aquimarina mytili TaxID=874423 RepID=A0A937D6A2_9FLAO|nr:tail fiber protein [Aquimarina mytili]MBL0684174.1 hypothetical protein [Aquimarina mytili]